MRAATCALLFLVGLTIPVPQFGAQAVGCSGSGCTGYNPQSMRCGTGAQTGPWGEFADGSVVENRYNTTCNAEWERTTNDSGGSRYAAGSILYPLPDWNDSQDVSSPGTISNGATVYTPMVGPRSINTSNCGDVSTVGPIDIPVTIHCVAPG